MNRLLAAPKSSHRTDRRRRLYALVVEGDGMRPRFASGDVLVIDPEKMPAPGDFVVVYDGGKIAEYPGEPACSMSLSAQSDHR